MAQTFLDSFITYKAKILYRGATPPNSAKYYLCLANTTSLTRASTKADFVGSELPQINGYARQAVTWATDGAFSNTTKRHNMPDSVATFQASGSSFQFQTYFLLADASANASKPFAPSAVNASTNVITITAHGLANLDTIMFAADAGSTLPAGLAASTLYTAKNITTTTFEVWDSAGSAVIALTGTGSGTFTLKYANGTAVSLEVRSSVALLQPNQVLTYTLTLAEMNVTYGNGV